MRRLLTGSLFASAVGLVLVTAGPAAALRIAVPPPSATRVATTDVIVIGRVTSIEPKELSLPTFPGAPATAKTTYRVAVVEVADVVKGTKGLKKVRVGFIAPPKMINPGPVPGPGGIRPGIRPGFRPGFGQVQLKAGDAGLFYLTKHFQGKIYTIPGMYDFTARGNANFDKELQEARANLKLLENPMENLKGLDREKRFTTAALLLAQYRRGFQGKVKTEPISAEESKLILLALADAPAWDNNMPVRFGQLHPQTLFFQLGVTAKDGWQPPMRVTTPQDFPNAIRAWLREHANTYRIQRNVPEAANESAGR
jgi:hypothetical protein